MELFDGTAVWMVAMGKTVVHSMWIGLLILALLRVILHQIPAKFSHIRYGISVSALIILFGSVLTAFIVMYDPFITMGEAGASRGLISTNQGNLWNGINDFEWINIHRIFNVFGQIYSICALAVLFRSFISFRYIRKLRNSGSRITPEWQQKFLQISTSLGISRTVDLFESALVKGPLLIGFLKPAVIIPAGMITNLPFSQIETILMHELYHVKRRDYLVNIVQLFIEGVLFYHPAVWIISGVVRKERENCCDDGVLGVINNPLDYAKALIHMAEHRQDSRLAPGAVGTNRHHLKSRINRILNTNTMKTTMRDRAASLILLTGSITILLVANGFSAGPTMKRSSITSIEMTALPMEPAMITVADTIPEKDQKAEKKELLKEIEEIDWEEMKAEMEDARREALEEIEEIDWEEMKQEMEKDFSQMKIDLEQMKIDIKNSMNEVDWDEIRNEMKKSLVFLDSLHIELVH